MMANDTMADDTSSTLRATADVFEASAETTSDAKKRSLLLDYARLYHEMAELSNRAETEADDRPGEGARGTGRNEHERHQH